MGVMKVKIGGREVTFQSEDDFARGMAALERVDAPEKATNRAQRNSSASKAYDAVRATMEFMEELVAHPEGVHSSVVAQALRCDPRGIGRRLLEVDAVLKPVGFKRDRVYDHSKRVAEGGRMYFPGADAASALEAVKRKAGSG